MVVKMSDVARAAGVSNKTVSNALNGYPYMRPETRERVLEAAAKLNYVRNESARALRSGRSHTIGLVLPDLRNAYFAELADTVMETAEQRGYKVVIYQTKGDRQRELESLRAGTLGALDGILFNALALGDGDGDLITGDVPIVLLGDHLSITPADYITMSNVDAAQAMTQHLLETGHRRIAVVGAHRGEIVGSAGLRLRGYQQALTAQGVPFDEDLIGYVDRWHRSDGAETMLKILSRGVDFDAVFGLNDMLALGAMRTLRDKGVVVPDEVSVVGFDDLEEAQYALPSLTTVSPGVHVIAEKSVDRLLARIDGDTTAATRFAAPFTLSIRNSSRTRTAESSPSLPSDDLLPAPA